MSFMADETNGKNEMVVSTAINRADHRCFQCVSTLSRLLVSRYRLYEGININNETWNNSLSCLRRIKYVVIHTFFSSNNLFWLSCWGGLLCSIFRRAQCHPSYGGIITFISTVSFRSSCSKMLATICILCWNNGTGTTSRALFRSSRKVGGRPAQQLIIPKKS